MCAGEALRLLEQCKELAPTLPELYTVQSRILKHAGDPQGAAEAACKAESMDLADRCASGASVRELTGPPAVPLLSVLAKHTGHLVCC